jgi:hypothetical protein
MRAAVGHRGVGHGDVAGVRDLSAQLTIARPRLVALQNALVDLLTFLDPDFIRFPQERRTKVIE